MAVGTYKPENDADGGIPADPRDATLALKSGVKLYGGFEGVDGETLENRDPEDHPTIFTGDLDDNDVVDDGSVAGNGENVYHVVTASDVDDMALLEGVTFIGGNPDRSSSFGGGSTFLTPIPAEDQKIEEISSWANR